MLRDFDYLGPLPAAPPRTAREQPWMDALFARVLQPPDRRPIWEWAHAALTFESQQTNEFAGQPYDISWVPHVRLIFDFFADPTARELHLMKSSAASCSTAVIVAICWYLKFKPCNVLYCINNAEEMKKLSKVVIQPFLRQVFGGEMIDDPDQSNKFFMLPGAAFYLGSPTEGFFRNKQCPIVVLDELDLYPDQLEGGANDPLDAGRERQKGAREWSKLITLSTPLRRFDPERRHLNQPQTKQHRAYLSGDMREFRIACPHCALEFAPDRQHLVFEHCRGKKHQPELPLAAPPEGTAAQANTEPQPVAPFDLARVRAEAYIRCSTCLGAIHEGAEKIAAVRRGRSVVTRTAEAGGNPRRWSARINDLVALIGNSRLGQIAVELVEADTPHAKARVMRSRFAEPEGAEDDMSLDRAHILKHCGAYPRGTCPVMPWFVGLTVDCQKAESIKRLLYKWVKCAFQPNGVIYVVDYGQTDSQTELRQILIDPILGPEKLPLFCSRALIDSGYRAGVGDESSFEDEVYPFCYQSGVRPADGTWNFTPVKGRSRHQMQGNLVKDSQAMVYQSVLIPLHLFNDEAFKVMLYKTRLAADPTNRLDPRLKKAPRIWLPLAESLDPGFVDELHAERIGEKEIRKARGYVTERVWYVPSNMKNDFGDCLKMGLVLYHIMAGHAPQVPEAPPAAPAPAL